MDNIDQDYLYHLWAHEIKEYTIDLVHNAMHFKLFAMKTDSKGEIHTQIDIYNVRMFCFGGDECYGDSACGDDGGAFPESNFDGNWSEFTEIETAQPGSANVKVCFNYSENVPSPYYSADQNIVIELPNGTLTMSAELIVINGKRFRWRQSQGAFVPEGSGKPGKREEKDFDTTSK